jgi:alpha-tubulin suppressor-like RCC1 family protein
LTKCHNRNVDSTENLLEMFMKKFTRMLASVSVTLVFMLGCYNADQQNFFVINPVKASGFIKIAAGGAHSFAVTSGGAAYAWGYNEYGQLGNGTTNNSNVPLFVLNDVIDIAGGEDHTVALKQDGTVWAWGLNYCGQLGNGNNTNSNIPVQVFGLANVKSIAAGRDHALALKQDGTAWAWGFNGRGQLGNGNDTSSNIPVQVSGLTNVKNITAGDMHTVALKNDGTVWAWGSNYIGGLGNGNNINSNIPVQVSGLTNVVSITAGLFHNTLALKNDGTVWAWGSNESGQLGNGTTNNSTTPLQVPGLINVASIAAGENHTVALKNDGTVWAWGGNSFGQLGNGNTYYYSTVPVQVPGLTGVISIAAGYIHTLALKQDNTVWAWGGNLDGELGNGSVANSNIPVKITGF